MSFKKSRESATEKILPIQEQEAKINEVRKIVGPVADKLQPLCSNESISRFLRARNWNTKKAAKMLKDTLKWRLEYRPENIRWEHVAKEAETGKIYRANYLDKSGRTVLVMRPGFQNTAASGSQIGYLVYCMENALTHSNSNQEQMVWLIDFERWNMSSVSMKVTRETAHVLQNRYPERLGLAILYNPPKIFESFWTMVKPFLEPKTYNKARFVYSNDPLSRNIMQEVFDMDKLESVFGGKNPNGFNYEEYAQRMKEDDKKDANHGSLESPALAFSGSLRSESMNSEYYDESSSPNDEASSNLSLLNVEVKEAPKGCKDDVKKEDEDKKLQTSKSV